MSERSIGGKLVLIGAGAHGRGTLEIVRARCAAGLPAPEPIGFVDDDPSRAGTQLGGLPVFGPLAWLLERADQRPLAILAIASARAKQALAPRVDAAGIAWAQAIHPSTLAASGVEFAAGAIVNAGVCIAFDTHVGRHTTLNLGCTVGHDCHIGDYATVAPGVNLAGRVIVGAGAEVQTNATVVPGLRLGDWSRVGPGSVVLRDVAEHESVFGNPARKVPAIDTGVRTT